jgi:hypothetical protein
MLVSALNVSLSIFAKKTGKQGGTFYEALTSTTFLWTMVIGTASVLCLIGVYRQGFEVSRGLLFMGALSILGGSLFALWYYGTKITGIEWILFGCIATLIAVRFWQMTYPSTLA